MSKRRKRSNLNRHNEIASLLMILPAFALLTIFCIVPLIMAFVRSFQDSTTGEFVNFNNYQYVLTNVTFQKSFTNVLIIGACLIVLQLVLSFLYAMLLRKTPDKISYIIRVLIYIPNLIAPVLVSIVFNLLINSSGGLFASISFSLGKDAINFTIDGIWPYVLIIGASIWGGFGYSTLIMYAGLLSIPKVYYEAAAIDGANSFQCMTKITLPSLRNALLLSLVGQITGALQMLDVPMFMTGGGPVDKTMTPALYLFNLFKGNAYKNTAIAGSIIVMIIIVGLNVLAFNFIKSRGAEEAV